MDYRIRIDRVIRYIGKHLDEGLTLEELCRVACFSKYHFHRLFTVHVGVSLQSYIKWLRLKRAAHQLVMVREDAIINVALDAGFESHEAFSRAFKQMCGQSPRAFRGEPNWQMWKKPPYSLPPIGDEKMDVVVKTFPSRKLALLEHRGNPEKLVDTLNKLITWIKSQPIDLKPKSGESFGFGYLDPREVPPEDFRFDLAVRVPDNFKLNNEVIERELPAGDYAIATHKGPRDNLGDTVNRLYRDWLPESGRELEDFPCVFCYYNFENEVAETELLTEVCMFLK